MDQEKRPRLSSVEIAVHSAAANAASSVFVGAGVSQDDSQPEPLLPVSIEAARSATCSRTRSSVIDSIISVRKLVGISVMK